MTLTYPIKGIPTTGGPLPVRPELSSWSISEDPQHQKQVSLFLRALDILQKKDPVSDQLSYFRLASIHGAPGKPWDNAADPENSMGSAKGYCYHNSYLFPVWHRPFMALYEQCLYNVMIEEILPQINVSQRSSWEDAAKQWRLPFWDWAIPQADTKALGLPRIASQEQFSILNLDGTGTEAIVNPMQKYTNRVNDNGKLTEVPMGDSRMKAYQITYNVHDKIDKKIELDFSKSKSTSRFANPQDPNEWANGYQRPELVNKSLQNPNWRWKNSEELTNGSLAHNVHRLLSENYFRSYKTFSSTLKGPGQDAKENLSLEMLHNNIHQWTGGGGRSVVRNGSDVVQIPVDGHMANVPVSSFDPIFWMHHNNVDRLFAIWQTLNPNRWLEASNPGDPQGSSKLVPFHRDSKATLFTVDDTRDWRKLGYTYPELGEGVTQEELSKLIFEKYGRQTVDELKASKDGSSITDTHFQDYFINVDYDRYALDGQPYTICFTLDLSDDKKYEVGQVFNFSAQLNRDCGNCNSQATEGVLSKGQVPLTPQLNRLVRNHKNFLRDASEVTTVDVGMNPEFMNLFLNKALHWHVRTNAGNEVPLEQVPNLQVTIHTSRAGFDDAKGAVYNVG